METLQIFYNKDLFQKLGLSVPTTWQQFETVSDTLKAQGITPIAGEYKDANLIDFYQSIFGATRYGGEDFRTALLAGQKNLQDPNYVAALQFLKENIVTKYFPADAGGLGFADARSLFLAQKAGMFPSGFWELTGFKTAGLNVGVFNMPPVPGALIDHPLTPWYSDGTIGVNAASPNKAAAIEVAKYIATKDFGNLLMKNNHYVSVVPGVNADDPLMAAELKNYSTDGTADIAVQDLDQGDPNGWTLIADQFQQYMYGKETAQVATADIMKGLDQWWKPGS
jgi:raffinose/stachyose/melibiose transport system substrate-binding protein